MFSISKPFKVGDATGSGAEIALALMEQQERQRCVSPPPDLQSTIVQQITYANAEVRGRLRQWKKKLAADYATFDAALQKMLREPPVADLALKKSQAGRKRALAKIHFGPGAVLEFAQLQGKYPWALWSILKPRGSVAAPFSEMSDEKERGSLLQDCVALEYIVAGQLPTKIGLAKGLWTIEVPDHALGRAVERSRLVEPGALIREAHKILLALPAEFMRLSDRSIYIKAGPGCFVGQFFACLGVDNEYEVHFRVNTWLHNDQLHVDQIPLSKTGEAGRRLGECWLVPRPFRKIEAGQSALTLQVHEWWKEEHPHG